MFVDSVTITVKAGAGGDGAATFRRDGQTAKGGPDGGNGGNGGNIFLQGTTNITDLHEFRYKKIVTAENGVAGRRSNLFGKNAPDTTILIPLGTTVTDLSNGRVFEITDTVRTLKVARGGHGGRGNTEFKSATNRTPTYAEKGQKGEEKDLHFELRIIADIGFIGLPNVGKSSLLAALTNAKPVIANYPFTTLQPNIGMMGTYALADIPGLIEGASEGKGLGIQFLKHIEKTKILVHCVDVTDKDPRASYETVRNEFREYNPALLEKPEIIVLTKTDLVGNEEIEVCKKLFQMKNNTIYTVSVKDEESVQALRTVLESLMNKI